MEATVCDFDRALSILGNIIFRWYAGMSLYTLIPEVSLIKILGSERELAIPYGSC